MSTLQEIEYACQLLSALTYLHTREPPIAHWDIKPENILCFVANDGKVTVKFADFGLTKHASHLKTMCGTYMWLPPEIYAKVHDLSADRYTAAVDIWSLGLIFAARECGLPA